MNDVVDMICLFITVGQIKALFFVVVVVFSVYKLDLNILR